MQVAFQMVLSLCMILFGAELFTNAIEWFGKRLGLGQGAVGSVLAALGTALPETAVPVTAILAGGGSAQSVEVGIGGILGAPFLLATLGSLVMAISLLLRGRFKPSATLDVAGRGFQRDMTFFLLAYSITVCAGCIAVPVVHRLVPLVLVGLYGLFLVQTLRDRSGNHDTEDLAPLYLQIKSKAPSMLLILLQLLVALALIVGGAKLLAVSVESVAVWLKIPTFVLSALLIPLATELPETLNSVVWIRQGKDALALGNITGAMVFQSTLVPALGISLTDWYLNPQALLTGALTLAAAALIFGTYRLRGEISPSILLSASMLYWVLPIQTVAMRYDLELVYWSGWLIVLVSFLLAVKTGLRYRSA